MAEFRWILLGLGTLLIGGIWWWGVRRSRQGPGASELREPMNVHAPAARPEPGARDLPDAPLEPRSFGVPPFNPIDIRTGDFEEVPAFDEPLLAEEPLAAGAPRPAAEPVESAKPVEPARSAESAKPVEPARSAESAKPVEPARSAAGGAEPAGANPQAAERQRIVSLRMCAVREAHWSGTELLNALERLGLAHGKYQVFHRRHSDGRTLFCVASLIEPGTFDLARMPGEEFRGVTLFAVLPGPIDALQIWDAMYATALRLAADLSGMVQDSQGLPMSPQRAAQLREDLARFQGALP